MEKVKQALNWVKKNLYEVVLTVVSVLILVEVLPVWTLAPTLLLSFAVWGYRNVKKQRK